MSGGRDRYQQSKKDARAAEVLARRGRSLLQAESARDIILRCYVAVTHGAPPDSFAGMVVELAEREHFLSPRNPPT